MTPDLHFLGTARDGAELPGPQAIGFKAWNLARMAALGLRIPPAFVLGTRHCAEAAAGPRLPEPLRAALPGALAELEAATGRRFGDPARPLLVSVRSGAPVSMPGMMDTLLDIGLCDATLPGLLRLTGNPRLAWDSLRRLVASHAEVVGGCDPAPFEAAVRELAPDGDERRLDWAGMRALALRNLALARAAGAPLPAAPLDQLEAAIAAVYASWRSPRAVGYRRARGIDDAMGTAVIVQAMVFGNAGGASGAGVGFTRDPTRGAPGLWVDFLFNAQGEDVVSGRRSAHGHDALAAGIPAVWRELEDGADRLERGLGDMQDIEFTVEDGRLWWLQTRAGKRTPVAAARIALDLHAAGVIDAAEARRRVAGLDARTLAVECLAQADGSAATPDARAPSASSGVAVGAITLDAEAARRLAATGRAVVLVRHDAETDDIAALETAAGLLTARGARTSHAAVVARQLGKVCLVGCDGLEIDPARRRLRLGDRTLAEGDDITLDGNSGAVYAGALATRAEADAGLLARLAALRAGECADSRPLA
ncbi:MULTISPECIES: PEP/pyruvate-binding domain-containing protein [Derxia]|uniref:PEP/pyruvate-binding domain-containing protein n=1 Tax=Derxia gummosa DSM 723 TaxID=1121388 RepID=A0A8B6X353_9BURK|nr:MULTISPECIES: PEP/pyruvate-binding domain-containing protein [Derxia]